MTSSLRTLRRDLMESARAFLPFTSENLILAPCRDQGSPSLHPSPLLEGCWRAARGLDAYITWRFLDPKTIFIHLFATRLTTTHFSQTFTYFLRHKYFTMSTDTSARSNQGSCTNSNHFFPPGSTVEQMDEVISKKISVCLDDAWTTCDPNVSVLKAKAPGKCSEIFRSRLWFPLSAPLSMDFSASKSAEADTEGRVFLQVYAADACPPARRPLTIRCSTDGSNMSVEKGYVNSRGVTQWISYYAE